MNELYEIKREVLKAFKLSGFQIRSELTSFLAEQLITLERDEQNKWINGIIENIQNQALTIPLIEKKHIDIAIRDCTQSGDDDNEKIFDVINAFDIPKVKYNLERKKFEIDKNVKKLLAEADMKAEYIADRYKMLWQRTTRHELFAPTIQGTTTTIKKFNLRKIENLLSTSKINEVVVLGLLTQLTEGKFYIEDPTGVIPLDISNAQFHSGLFCEGCFILAEGKYSDGVLNVAGLGFPPPESAASSRAYFGVFNSWGGKSKFLLKNSKRLAEIERQNVDATIIFISDCWLDNETILEKLKMLFNGYDDCPPTAIILMGPFSKKSEGIYSLKNKFQLLGDIIANCDNIKKETDIVLVPSSEDPSSPNILPRPPIPNAIVSELKKKVPRLILATNPCRLQYCTQQIVVCRADLVTKLCRNALQSPKIEELENHFARTLICQGTLAPLHQIALPIFWNCDAAMSLYPLPDLIVVGDSSQGFHITQQGCTVINTGSFPKSKFSFKVYIPSTKTVEDSQIPDPE